MIILVAVACVGTVFGYLLCAVLSAHRRDGNGEDRLRDPSALYGHYREADEARADAREWEHL